MTAPQTSKEALMALNILTAINKLTLKAFATKNKKNLAFLILNDTIQVIRYDRAVLWSYDNNTPKMLGVSGQTAAPETSDFSKKLKVLVEDLQDPNIPHVLSAEYFVNKKDLWKQYSETPPGPSVLWFPIMSNGKRRLGLWLERWGGSTWTNQEGEILNFLVQAYGLAWENLTPYYGLHTLRKKVLWIAGVLSLLALFVIRVPLRIVAPCEVVPRDPIMVTAPLEDIIDKVDVKPGEIVHKGEILFEYDKRVALQSLKIAQNQVRVAQEDLSRAKTLAFKEEKALAEVSILEAKLKKEQANLALAKYRASQLVVHSPQDGVTIFENPDEWRGKPVKVGEKVMMVSDPNHTKIRLWIPESDNIPLEMNKPIYIFLNVTPTVSREAKLEFISNASTVTPQNLVSFMAEAEWVNPNEDVKLGLKGSAILYGEKVSLIYWIIRKPWISLRNFLGI